MIKCSVVIPLYNKTGEISRALSSVLIQTVQDFEVIVVDDGSTDGGHLKVEQCKDPRIRLIRQKNTGVSAARNRGVDEAGSGLVVFLDADDEWKPGFLATIFRLYEKYPEAGLHATAYDIQRVSPQRIMPEFKGVRPAPWEGIIPYFRSAAYGAPPVCASAVCIPKRVFMEVGGFAVGKRMGEDLDLWARIALRYPVTFSSHVGATYYQNADNRACLSFNRGDEHPFIDTAEVLFSSGGVPEEIVEDVRLYVTRLRVENMRQHVLTGNIGRARELYRKNGNGSSVSPLRQLLWGSRLNRLTRYVWYMRYCGSRKGL